MLAVLAPHQRRRRGEGGGGTDDDSSLESSVGGDYLTEIVETVIYCSIYDVSSTCYRAGGYALSPGGDWSKNCDAAAIRASISLILNLNKGKRRHNFSLQLSRQER